ncbi:sensor histidine kinase [Clostridium amazonitimonense]|uniref:sensor histidine kinase n=1 Tax=Clostridium amazonitimonense TaxID=1499689 RepID=UPI0005097217|nr:HAMP domain-containing sensor histidine kinase [Clostridium amazonitimonense]
MATKLKSSKILRFIAIAILTGSLILSGIIGKDLVENYDSIKRESFYKTHRFKNILKELNNALINNFTIYKGEEEIKNLTGVPEAEIKKRTQENLRQYEQAINNIEERFKGEIRWAKESDDKEELDSLLKSKENDIGKVKKNILKSEDDIKSDIINERMREYNNNLNVINKLSNIKYVIVDNEDNRTETNIEDTLSEEAINSLKEKSDFYLILKGGNNKNIVDNTESTFTKEELKVLYDEYFGDGYGEEINKNLSISYFIPKDYFYYDNIKIAKSQYESVKESVAIKLTILGACFIALILSLIYLRIYRKNENVDKGFLEKLYGKLWIEIQLGLISLGGILVLVAAYQSLREIEVTILLGITIVFEYYLLFFTYKSFKEVKEDQFKEWIKRKSLIYKIINFIINKMLYKIIDLIKGSFLIKSTGFKIGAFLIFTFIFMCSMVFLHGSSGFGTFVLMIYILTYIGGVTLYIIKFATYLNKIVIGSSNIAKGDLNYTIEEQDKGILKTLAYNINNMKVGLKKSLNNEMKSERMKTELITNVSHDLKTPLTSIINYVDLIKNEDLTPEERNEYIQILERKSQRLKVLIEDLFEASKAASGEVELNIERVDIVALLKQSLAEFEEKIKVSSLDFRVKVPEEKLYIMVDGKKTWRILENQITNILKYTLNNTRVYITVEDIEDKVVITMKNISAFEIDFHEEEILERFKRGDQSRNTEGSGLGLAISSNLTKLQGGEFKVNTDGDLFKVTIEFPKS